MTDDEGLRSRRIGEVVEAESTAFVAQCFQLHQAPALGSLVRAGSPPVFAVVCNVSTLPLDPTRPVLARGEAAGSEEDIFRDNPQLYRLFATRFRALIAGHVVNGDSGDGDSGDGDFRQVLPPLPPPVHSFAYACSPEETARFSARLDFLPLLLGSGLPVADEVAAACLRLAAGAQPDGAGFLSQACRSLAGHLANDLPRLHTILRKVAP